MQRTIRVSLAAGISAVALAGAGFHSAKAADIPAPQYQAPPPAAYAPPPVHAYAYPPPPPPVAYYYPPPAYVVWPRAYYWPGPYWGGPRFAYGYGRWGWGHGWRR